MAAKVFLITHDSLLAKAYGARLRRTGFEVEHRSTGHEALARARQWTPDLILLDLALPGLHGLDVLKLLRDVPWLVKVPVVLLVDRTLNDDTRQECLLWGANRVLEKDSCSVEEITEQLKNLLAIDNPA